MKLAIEDSFGVGPESNVFIIIKRHPEHLASTPNKFKHTICQCRIAGLKISNCIHNRFTRLYQLTKVPPKCEVLDRNIDDISGNWCHAVRLLLRIRPDTYLHKRFSGFKSRCGAKY
jgi:hypothetical protein